MNKFQRSLGLLPQAAPMEERILHYATMMTRQRDRVQLMARLSESLFDLLAARSVRLYRLFSPPGARYVGLSVASDGDSLQVFDDNVSWPAGTCSIERYPELRACLRYLLPQSEREMKACRYIYPILLQGSAEVFGFLDIRRDEPLDDQTRVLFEGLLQIFGNCLGLLDYSEMDTLTGLLNRKTFDSSLVKLLSRLSNEQGIYKQAKSEAQRRQNGAEANAEYWLGVVDIDHFKLINDTFGHPVGDETLVSLSNMMRQCFRVEDKLFRFGGEEFLVLLMPTEAENAFAAFERFRREVEAARFPQIGQMTVSVGFARIQPQDAASVVIDNADEALYWAKTHGRNQVCSYEELVAYGMLKKKSLPAASPLDLRKS